MELMLATARQHEIADLLWAAESQSEVNAVIRQFGVDAVIVRDLMIAAVIDQVEETDLAERVLVDIMSK